MEARVAAAARPHSRGSPRGRTHGTPMTWALVIGSWVAVALVAGLLIGAMIRRAEARDLTSDDAPAGAEPSQDQPAQDQPSEGRRARVSHGLHLRRSHPFE